MQLLIIILISLFDNFIYTPGVDSSNYSKNEISLLVHGIMPFGVNFAVFIFILIIFILIIFIFILIIFYNSYYSPFLNCVLTINIAHWCGFGWYQKQEVIERGRERKRTTSGGAFR